MTADPYDLHRFVEAQDGGGSYEHALAELTEGRKTSHWMWYVFPQLRGLGRSPTAVHYGIDGIDEAKAYLEHPVLSARLRACADVLLTHHDHDAIGIFGAVDAMKLRSSMTLFLRTAPGDPQFAAVLERYFDGQADAATDALL